MSRGAITVVAAGLAVLLVGSEAWAALQGDPSPSVDEEPQEQAKVEGAPAEERETEPSAPATAPEQPEKSPEASAPAGERAAQQGQEDAEAAKEAQTAQDEGEQPRWRDDPSVARHPGSYIGGGAGYSQIRAWVEANEDHGDLEFGPMHSWYASLRVGDAFTEWFALGFQVELANAYQGKEQVGAFNLLLDASFYPIGGLGIRPAVGLGLGFANGKEEWEFGGGGPGCLSLSVLYEIRITRLFVVAPVAQTFWITGQGFDGLFLFFGLEFIKWFETPTG